ncbi:MAG: hypothetical protein IJP92_01905 [Lachnospiraceae bacterium]|nr:hypothetical protein [Lachnospiraceae bacterium]
MKELSQNQTVQDAFVYHFSDMESASSFAEKINICRNGEQLSLFGNRKVITEYNFYDIFLLWNKMFEGYVENGRKSSEYFMTDIEQGRTSIVDNKQVLFRLNSGENTTKYMPMAKYNHFWNTYERQTDIRQVEAIRQKMDRMTEINLRRFTGEYFTPLPFAMKAIEYIERVVKKKNWWISEKYRLWDMAAGTGNLEYQLPAEVLKYCYISTLLEDDAEYCKSIFPDATVFQYDYLNDDVNILIHPELIDKGVKHKMPDNLVKDLNNPEIKWILFFNPPYVTSNNNERNKTNVSKDSVSMTEIQKAMTEQGLGETSRELMSQFVFRISMEFEGKDAYIAMFSKIKFINAPNDQRLRSIVFNYTFNKGFVFSSKCFSDCRASFPVGFTIWTTAKRKALEKQRIILDVFNEHTEKNRNERDKSRKQNGSFKHMD